MMVRTLGASNPVMDFFRSTAKDLVGDKEIKTEALVLAISQITGSNPIVDRSNPNVNVIKFTKAQRLKLESYFSKKSKGKGGKPSKPSNVVIEHKPLWMPLVIKKATPYILGIGLLGFIIGKAMK